MLTLLKTLDHGGVATTVLFVQLGIVVALGGALLWLVVRRLRKPPLDATAPFDQDAWLHEVLAERQDQGDAVREENRSLREKIRFLEAKVLEFEILNQQMGSLPTLKHDNEKLKSEIRALRALQAAVATAAVEPLPKESAGGDGDA